MRVRTIIAGAVGAVSLLLALPVSAASLTPAQVNAILGLLRSFGAEQSVVSSVEATLTGAMTTTTSATSSYPGMMGGSVPPGQVGKMFCIALNRDLRMGSEGDDVRSLQQMLAEDPESGFSVDPTGYFGPLTARALVKFQEKNRIAMGGAGIVGPLTRGFFERRCGKGLGKDDDKGPSVIGNAVIDGTVASVDGATIMVTLSGKPGVTATVLTTASTTIQVFVATSTPPRAGSLSDVVAGVSITVEGKTNLDGTITAKAIRVGFPPPPMRIMSPAMHDDQEDN